MPLSNVQICFVGDSFVNGTGDSECLGWTGRICSTAIKQGHDITYYNLGIRRETSTDIAERWFEEVARRLPESCDRRILFSFGVNDTTIENGKPRVELSKTKENTLQILSIAKNLFSILMVSPPPIVEVEQNSRIETLSQELAIICEQLNVPYLDVFTPLQKSEFWLKEVAANDSYHPNAAGYSAYANLVQNWDAWQGWLNS
ncbi:lipase [Phormidium sp. LEGE 05292]|uniref:GDSL-type esterase/lipase family protein n=1 Tax=[Phormidium] sp. LEGE 05292 TaxID=767427 RepID=UPI0018814FA1|nr:GDSL-type esterase/lipase family protein [Phormidium sp. LEGE 05292]MBE9228712.1 lipase [Phormidium sp. LEGE 05292]